MPEFPDLAPWPDSPAPADRYHNQPPLEDRLTLAFDDTMRARGLDKKVEDIIASAGRAPEIDNPDDAGKAGELVRMAREVKREIDDERELLNRPVLNAGRALKAKADALLVPMGEAVDALKSRLAVYLVEQADVVEKPVVVGDYGARAGLVTQWDFEILALAKVPKVIREHPTVIEAIEKVIRAQVRGGARQIAGVRIFPTKSASVR